MNARQKAKKYKRLYERLKVPYNTVFVDRTELKHYKVAYRVSNDLLIQPHTTQTFVVRELTDRMSEAIIKNMVIQDMLEYDCKKIECDFWMRN